ncbi:MAG: hypothetical protein A3F68_00535 [Acidobacteria bacterium RIFCSPLOWO2_12_FULL_54_10]|nr:MAG: hypothetical protein A3F68_00535 [Acidobacteria bacterium RIFCSPLOWO2_12_FULL_54_10]
MNAGVTIALLLALSLGTWSARAEDYLTPREADDVRAAQDSPKRIVLFLDFAQRRLDAMKQLIASRPSGFASKVRTNLEEYRLVLEDLQTTMDTARDKRISVDKALKEVDVRGSAFLSYLQSIPQKPSSGWDDFRYALEEAVVVTQEKIAEAQKGSFPEVLEREPPRLPSAPPQQKDESERKEGPPRRGERR